MKRKEIKLILGLSIIPLIALVKIISSYPNQIEHYFSQNFYPLLFNFQKYLFQYYLFSIGDLIYLLIIIYSTFLLSRFVIKFKVPTKHALTSFGMFISIVFITFQLNWGLNYHRIPLSERLNIEKQYSDTVLYDLTNKLVAKSNLLHNQLSSSDTSKVIIPHSKNKLIDLIQEDYSDLFPSNIKIPKVKPSLYSLPLSYMGYGGYLNPFTLEAQVNIRIPKINLPVTIAHEMAHQLGYAAENEANFIGFVNTYQHKDLYIKYCATLFALRHSYGDLKKRDPQSAQLILNKLNKGIFKNFAETSAFWEEYKNPFEPYFKSSYDVYLKANGQKEGIKTYNQIVAFLISYNL